jgi:hypothetical protein
MLIHITIGSIVNTIGGAYNRATYVVVGGHPLRQVLGTQRSWPCLWSWLNTKKVVTMRLFSHGPWRLG